MARRSIRKTRHHRPYEMWKRPTPMEQMVALIRELTPRYPESAYEATPRQGKAGEP